MKLVCKHCKRKDSYKMTKAAYDDLDYTGIHEFRCKTCGLPFGIKLDGYNIRVVK